MFLQTYCILRLNVQHTSGKGYHETQSTKGDGEIALADERKGWKVFGSPATNYMQA